MWGVTVSKAIQLLVGDCVEVLSRIDLPSDAIFVTDPPFNIGYKYAKYKDKIPEDKYYEMLASLFAGRPHIIVHYPEALYKYAIRTQNAPRKVISWVYNSNTPKQHRDIAFFNIEPDMKKVGQQYKNPTDKRIKQRIEAGKMARLYDWWEVNQVKNTNTEKTAHPCQMPVEIMKRIVGVLPNEATIVDPFLGSGTTAVACQQLGRAFIGIDIDPSYVDIARNRLDHE